MKNYQVAFIANINAERDGHAEYISDQISGFLDLSLNPNFDSFSYLLIDDEGDIVVAKNGSRDDDGVLVVSIDQEFMP